MNIQITGKNADLLKNYLEELELTLVKELINILRSRDSEGLPIATGAHIKAANDVLSKHNITMSDEVAQELLTDGAKAMNRFMEEQSALN